MKTNNKILKALTLASEYRAVSVHDAVRLEQLHRTIDELVGGYVDGRWTIPYVVADAMGRDDLRPGPAMTAAASVGAQS